MEIIKTKNVKNLSEYKLLLHCLLNTHCETMQKPTKIIFDKIDKKLNILLKHSTYTILYTVQENNEITSISLPNSKIKVINDRLKSIDIAA